KSDLAEAHGGLALALSRQDNLDGALESYREALRLRPDVAGDHVNMGFILSELGRRSEALACYDRALALDPGMPDARTNRAYLLLLEGKLAEGWAEYEWRWKRPELPERPFPQPLWDGSPLDGKTIMLHAEQGFGDTLHFIRYARLVHERGGRVIVVCQRPLVALLSRCEAVEQVLAHGDPLPPFDVHAPLLSLPRIFGTTLANIPGDVPYIQGEPRTVARWRDELGGVSDFKIGIAWQGSRAHRGDHGRSMPLSYFAPLAAISGVRLYSLQKNDGQEQLGQVSFGERIVDLSPRLESFDDTAAAMEHLDLVICCDTSVAHLAGALARPVWVAVATVPDWRWLLDRDDTPWYPTMRLFRQHRRGDWHDVFARITSALAEWTGATMDVSTSTLPSADQHGQQTGEPADAHYKLGATHAAQRRWEEAAAGYRQAVALRPGHAEAHRNLGDALRELGRADEAILNYGEALRLKGDFAEAHGGLAMALAQRGDLDGALTSCR
ncbi:MAG TPA: tetratricopeptide repeat protein, partial [Pirellulales bacterium]|nr:tetratricopeptide repeat protein [Pirellulales bacterium]